MEIPTLNVKILIGLSAVLAVVFLLTLLITANKKSQTTQKKDMNYLTPTQVEAPRQFPIADNPTPTIMPSDFTGVREEPMPTEIVNFVNQKQELRRKLPLTLSSFNIDFDYSQDKFTVNLNTPKDQSLKEFQTWKNNNYPALNLDQFIIN